MKILLLKFRNIGDVLLVTPLIKNLKNNYPKALIDFSVNQGTEDMITLNPGLHRVITYDREETRSLSIFKRLWREVKFVSSFKKENYDIIINLTNGDRGDIISWYSNAPIRIGYKTNKSFFKKSITHEMPEQKLRHTLETALDALRVIDLPVTEKVVEIFWSQEDENFISKKLDDVNNFIHIHPVSRWNFKCISDSMMAQIIDYCQIELRYKVILTASKDIFETQKVDNILSLTKSSPLNFSGNLSLKQTAALNNRATLFIGVDTSIMHISASNNIPSLAFFGPSGADNWGPWDNNLKKSTYLKRNGIQSMGIHRVFSESRNCQPCGNDGCSGTKISDCLMSMDLNKIKENILEMLNDK